jgi:hypothetical protein
MSYFDTAYKDSSIPNYGPGPHPKVLCVLAKGETHCTAANTYLFSYRSLTLADLAAPAGLLVAALVFGAAALAYRRMLRALSS